MVIPLGKMQIGNKAQIVWIASEDPMAKHLKELGFVPGGTVRYILNGPPDGMRGYLISDSLVALRDSTAGEILVRPLG